ncbi:MAG TPA: hypothetical protein VN969_06765 [Streptosporangiaceae bacterium]|nr:hypothetical protein [Streptosporangiaceae bacterium]
MSKVTRAAVRGALAVGLLAGVSAVGATSASAQALSESYTCTSSYPEVCLGVYYGGSSGFVSSEEMRGNLDYDVTYRYMLQTPGGGLDESPWATTGAAGWAPSYPEYDPTQGQYCAYIEYLVGALREARDSAKACVSI